MLAEKRARGTRHVRGFHSCQAETMCFLRHGGLRPRGVVADLDVSVANRGDVGIFFEGIKSGAQFSLGPPVVAVEESDNGRMRFGNGRIVGGDLAAIFLVDIPDAGCKFRDKRCGVVG